MIYTPVTSNHEGLEQSWTENVALSPSSPCWQSRSYKQTGARSKSLTSSHMPWTEIATITLLLFWGGDWKWLAQELYLCKWATIEQFWPVEEQEVGVWGATTHVGHIGFMFRQVSDAWGDFCLQKWHWAIWKKRKGQKSPSAHCEQEIRCNRSHLDVNAVILLKAYHHPLFLIIPQIWNKPLKCCKKGGGKWISRVSMNWRLHKVLLCQ